MSCIGPSPLFGRGLKKNSRAEDEDACNFFPSRKDSTLQTSMLGFMMNTYRA